MHYSVFDSKYFSDLLKVGQKGETISVIRYNKMECLETLQVYVHV